MSLSLSLSLSVMTQGAASIEMVNLFIPVIGKDLLKV